MRTEPTPIWCSFCRSNDCGGMKIDGDYICFDCVEMLIERENAIGIADANGFGTAFRQTLEPLWPPRNPSPRPRSDLRGPVDTSKLDGLRRKWLDYEERQYEDAELRAKQADL